jgi:uncharacterized membrane protein YdjX (TVP38/TMEM64 family)
MDDMTESQGPSKAPPPQGVSSSSPISLRFRLILGVFVFLLISVFYLTGLYKHFSWEGLKEGRDRWRSFVDQHQWWSACLFLLISITLMSISLPVGSALSLSAGALFDFWLGTGLIIVASAFGSLFAFLAARYLFRDIVRRWFGRWLGIVDRGIERDGALYLFMLRLSPVVPFFAVNPVMGLTKIRTGTFFWVSQIGMLPSCFLYVFAGTQLAHLNSPKDILSLELFGVLLLLAIMPLICRLILRRRDTRAVS